MPYLPDLPLVREEMSYYYNSTKRLDDTFGKIMQLLEERGLKENTLVIFMSDNGIAVPFAKCDNYNASNRTPWIARWPGVIRAGAVNDQNFISGVDFMPTVLDAAGINPPKKMDGVSHWPLYIGKNRKNTGMIFTQIDNKAPGKPMPMRGLATHMRGIQTSEYIYIFNAWVNGERIYANNNEGLCMEAMENESEVNSQIAERVQFFRYRVPEEFYDLSIDPHSLNNLINDPEYAGKIRKFRKIMKKNMHKTGDPLLYVFLHRDEPEKFTPELYKIYPEIKILDKEALRNY